MWFFGDNLHEDQLRRKMERKRNAAVREKGMCYFIDDGREDWHRAGFFFLQDHALEFEYGTDDGQIVTKQVNYAIYDMDRALNGIDANWAYGNKDWRPDKQPGENGEKCSLETVVVISNKTKKKPDLWLQFPTIKYFIKFYDYWLNNVRSKKETPVGDYLMLNSIDEFNKMKERVEKEEQEAKERAEAAKRAKRGNVKGLIYHT